MRKKQIDTLREQRDALVIQREIKQLQGTLAAHDLASRHITEGWGDLIDPRAWLNDEPGFQATTARRASRHDDRANGRFAPFFETEQDLAEARGIARYLAATDETSIGILESLTNYVMGTGFTYSVTPRKGRNAPDDLVHAMQDVLDEFIEQSKWRRVEREAFVRSRRDGEFFLRLQHLGNGRCRPRFIEPDYVREPLDKRAANEYCGQWDLDWLFGVATDLGDTETVYGYHVDWSGDGRDWDFLPAGEVEHCKLNVDSGIKRGVSDFYAAYTEIDQANKVSRNTAEGAAIQAAIAWVREHAAGTTQTQVRDFQSGKADLEVTRPAASGATRSVKFQRYDPGTILDVAKGFTHKPGPMGSERNPFFIQALQMCLRRVGNRWQMPEYLVSGDASNANYSSTLVAESPFVKACESKQVDYDETFTAALWKVLHLAHRWGRFGGNLSWEEVRRLVTMSVDAPRVSVRNRREETEIRKMLVDSGLMAKKTWAAQEDLDYDEEVAAGATPAGVPPSQAGNFPESLTECGGEGGTKGPCPKLAADAGGQGGGGRWRHKKTRKQTHKDIGSLWDDATSGQGDPSDMLHVIGNPSDAVTREIGRVLGEKVPSGTSFVFEGERAKHIKEGHGIEPRSGQVPLTRDDALKIPDVLMSPDKVTYTTKMDKAGKPQPTTDKDGNRVIQFSKRTNGKIIVATAVRKGTKSFAVVSAYKFPTNPLKESDQPPDLTSETEPGLNRPLNAADPTVLDSLSFSGRIKAAAAILWGNYP